MVCRIDGCPTRSGLASGRRLLHAGTALVLPSSREGEPIQRGSRPPYDVGVCRCLPRGVRYRSRPPRAFVPAHGSRSARCAARGGPHAAWSVRDHQAPCAACGSARGDMRAQLPGDGDHGVPAERRRPGGCGADRGPNGDGPASSSQYLDNRLFLLQFIVQQRRADRVLPPRFPPKDHQLKILQPVPET